jgi:hypothetical protein
MNDWMVERMNNRTVGKRNERMKKESSEEADALVSV